MRVKTYLHANKDSNWELGERIGLSEDAIRNHFRGINYEVEIEYEVDMETGEYEMIAVNGSELKKNA